MANPIENLNASVTGCQHEASIQAETALGLDAKLMGILGFMAAVAGLLLTLNHGVESYRWILLVGAGGAVLFALMGLVSADDTKSGPDPLDFFNKYVAAPPGDFAEQMIADFRTTLEANKSAVEERREAFSAAFGWAVLAGIVFGVARLLVWLLS